MTKREAGRLGGLTTAGRYGREYMAAIGKRGAATLYQRHDLRPYQLTKFALVDRGTGDIKAIR